MFSRFNFDLAVVCLTLFLVALSVNLQLPLYPKFSAQSGFGVWFVAAMFSAYIIGLVPVLIFLGGISDYIGIKKALLLAIFLSLVANVLIIFRQDLLSVFVMRVLQGVSIGLVLGAAAVFMSSKVASIPKAANVHGVLVALGLGGGALLTSMSIIQIPSDTPASFYGVTALVLICLIALCFITEEKAPTKEGLFRLPIITGSTWIYCYSIFLGWSLVGVVISVVPSELNKLGLSGWTGLVVFLAVSTGAFFQPFCRSKSASWSLRTGIFVACFAAILLVVAVWLNNGALLLIASAMTGASGLGFIYIGGLASVMDCPEQERARSVSGYFTVGYLGLGIPCIFVGYASDLTGLFSALCVYMIVILIISIPMYSLFTLSENTENGKFTMVVRE